ncbi:MAG: hypothetical protein E6Q97_18375 [Desulfurellales bacterium]|nr:MAG: hypothetical protein E6Q97_18375 [Desulfurellales bacterium]
MSKVVFGNREGERGSEFIELEANRIAIQTYQQSYQSYSAEPGLSRTSQAGVDKKALFDLSGGLLASPDIQDFENAYNRYSYNEGIQTRIKGMAILPFALTNQTSLTNGENIATGVASNYRCHGLNTAVGGTQRYLVAAGQRILRAKLTSALGDLEVASGNIDGAGSAASMGAVVTCLAELMVNGSRVVAAALKGAANIVYTTDPGATPIVWTTLVNTSSGDYITGMQFFQTLGPGANVIAGKIAGTNGFFYELADVAAASWSLKPVVLVDNKDDEGSIATVDTSAEYAGWGESDFANQINNSGTPGVYAFGNPDNIVGDTTGTYAAFEPQTDAAIGDATGPLYAGGFDFSDVPDVAIVKGVLLEVEKSITDSQGNVADISIALLVNGGQKGIDRPDASGYWGSKAFTSYGGLTDNWGAEWTGAHLKTLVVRLKAGHPFEIPAVGMALNTEARVHRVRVSARWRMPGQMVSLPLGGFMVARNPVFPLRMSVVTPRADDTDGITVPRELWHIDLAWDPASGRPLMATSQANVGMLNVHAASPFQGGYMVVGDNVVGPGQLVKSVDVNGDLRNFSFPGFHGEEVKVNSCFSQGQWATLDVINADFSDRQWWYWGRDTYYPDTLLQSLSDMAIAAQPLPWGTAETNLNQNLMYSLFPRSSNTAVVRQYLPSNLGLDPRLVDDDADKTLASGDVAVHVTSNLLTLGPPEALQTLLVAAYQGNDANDDDTVTLEVAMNGGSFGAPDVSTDFTEAMQEYEVPDAGVAYQYLQYRLGLSHSDTDATPNALPILLTSEHEWPAERQIIVWASDFKAHGNIFNVVQLMETVQALRSVQPLYLLAYPDTERSIPAVFEGYVWPQSGVNMPPPNQPRAAIPAKLTREVRGDLQDLDIGFVFRTVPGRGDS